MRRTTIALLTLLAACGCGVVLAQGGSLAGVTMRVLDDIAGLDAVIIELPAAPAAN
jgi:hypothetical protein